MTSIIMLSVSLLKTMLRPSGMSNRTYPCVVYMYMYSIVDNYTNT